MYSSGYLRWAIFGRSCRRRAEYRKSWRKVPLRLTIYRTCSAGMVCLSIFPAKRTHNCHKTWCSFSSGRFSVTFCYGQNRNPTALCCKPCPSADFHILCPCGWHAFRKKKTYLKVYTSVNRTRSVVLSGAGQVNKNNQLVG